MHIGVPVEVKNNENRVAMTPAGVLTLTRLGHEVYIEKGAGVGSGFGDDQYLEAGAHLVETAAEAWSKEMVMTLRQTYPLGGQVLKQRTSRVAHLS